jgi:hypothetical protein
LRVVFESGYAGCVADSLEQFLIHYLPPPNFDS